MGVLEFIEETENELKRKFGDNIQSDYVSLNGIMESHNSSIWNSILNDVIWIYESNEIE